VVSPQRAHSEEIYKSVITQEFSDEIVELDMLEQFEMCDAFRQMSSFFGDSVCEIPVEHEEEESYNEVAHSGL